jgi:hypothetical protein
MLSWQVEQKKILKQKKTLDLVVVLVDIWDYCEELKQINSKMKILRQKKEKMIKIIIKVIINCHIK